MDVMLSGKTTRFIERARRFVSNFFFLSRIIVPIFFFMFSTDSSGSAYFSLTGS
jgi:hypothetical protein